MHLKLLNCDIYMSFSELIKYADVMRLYLCDFHALKYVKPWHKFSENIF